MKHSKTTWIPTALIAIALLPHSANAQTTTSGGGAGSSPTLETPVQTPAAQPTQTTATGSNTISAPFRIKAPKIGSVALKAGLKSQNTTGRLYDYDDPNGRRYQEKHEYYLGAVLDSGWGGYGQAVTSGTEMANKGVTRVGAGDPSLTILHPNLYTGQSLTLSGQFRRYFAVSDRSVNRDQKQWAYYLYTSYKLPAQWSIFNQTTPRYFEQSYYTPGDTTYYLEDLTTISKALNANISVGLGQWTQVEWHRETTHGVSTDLSLFARFTPIANLWIEPRLITPVVIKNAVYDQSKNVSLQGARAEIYAQMTL